jgi:hypothetical protein
VSLVLGYSIIRDCQIRSQLEKYFQKNASFFHKRQQGHENGKLGMLWKIRHAEVRPSSVCASYIIRYTPAVAVAEEVGRGVEIGRGLVERDVRG